MDSSVDSTARHRPGADVKFSNEKVKDQIRCSPFQQEFAVGDLSHFPGTKGPGDTIGSGRVPPAAIELATLAARRSNRITALTHIEAAEAAFRDLDVPAHRDRAQRLATELRHAR
jgi:hypothetical protein